MEQIRVLLANHQPIVRNGLRSLLERDSKIRVIGEAANGQEAVVLAQYQHPDVAILDVQLDSVRGIDAARTLSSKELKIRVVILGTLTDESYVQEAFTAGARGYVLGDSAQSDLQRAVFVVAAGGIFLSPVVSGALIEDWNRGRNPQHPALAERQKHLFSLLVDGRLEAEIAEMLKISEDQVHSECEGIRNSLQHLGISKALYCYLAG